MSRAAAGPALPYGQFLLGVHTTALPPSQQFVQHFLSNPGQLTTKVVETVAAAAPKSKHCKRRQAIVRSVLAHHDFPPSKAVLLCEHLLLFKPPTKVKVSVVARIDNFIVSTAETDSALASTLLTLLHAHRQELPPLRWHALVGDVLCGCVCYDGPQRVDACLKLISNVQSAIHSGSVSGAGNTVLCKLSKALAKLAGDHNIDATTRNTALVALATHICVGGLGRPPVALRPSSSPNSSQSPQPTLGDHGARNNNSSNNNDNSNNTHVRGYPATATATLTRIPSKLVTSSVVRAIVHVLNVVDPTDVHNAPARAHRQRLVCECIVPQVSRKARLCVAGKCVQKLSKVKLCTSGSIFFHEWWRHRRCCDWSKNTWLATLCPPLPIC